MMKIKIKLEILNKLDNIYNFYDIIALKKDKNIIYELLSNNYVWTIDKNNLIISSKSNLEYSFELKEKKTITSFLKDNDYIFKVYIYTDKLLIKDDKIELSYNIYSDENLCNIISSYDITMKIYELC